MLRICSKALVRMVKPTSVTRVAGRNLSQNLPKMPIPTLQRSCEQYLSCLETIVEEDELKRTKGLVEEFLKEGGVGERLQRELEKDTQNADNWYTGDWEKALFLRCRHPAVLHSGFGLILPRMYFTDKEGQIRCAAEMVAGLLEMKTLIDSGTLPVDFMKGKPMCMDQYQRVWSSCRIPSLMGDRFEMHNKNPNPRKHIAVIHNCQFFTLDVYNSDGSPLTVDQLCVQLRKVCIASPLNNTDPVGVLTTQNRDLWSKTYDNLMQDETNKESLQAIQTSLFTVCLDRAPAEVPDDMYATNAILHNLHGGGCELNSGNRWFDKSMQVFVGEKGTCGLTFQFVAIDGMVGTSIADYINEYIKRKKPDEVLSPMEPLQEPQKLDFNLTPEIKEDIEEAKQHIDTIAQEVFLKRAIFEQCGKDFLKAHKIDHHSFMQMVFQLAYYRTFQKVCVTMQPTSLRYFNRGRLNVIVCNTPDSTAFVKAFDDPNKQISEKMDLLDKAMKTNRSNINKSVNSEVITGHLAHLTWRAMENNTPLSDFFTDPNFMKFYSFQLVPSTISSKSGLLQWHSPSEAEAFEILYDIQSDQTEVKVTTYKEDYTDVFLKATQDALVDMRTLLELVSGANVTANPDINQ